MHMQSAPAPLKGIESLINQRRAEILHRNPFYRQLPEATREKRLSWCHSLYHVSRDYIELLRLRSERHGSVQPMFADHYEEEKEHPGMLRQWMIENGLGDPELELPTPETTAFLAIMYRVALGMNPDMSLLVLNSTSEGLALDFFRQCYQRLSEAGYSNLEYWLAHEADEEHSQVYHLIGDMGEGEAQTAAFFVDYTLDCADRMLRSWAAPMV